MRISVKAKPNSYEEKIDPPSSGGFGPLRQSSGEASEARKDYYTIWVKEPPVNGLANKAIMKVLREYFHTPNVRIVSGYTSRNKIVEIG